jgi:GT2 family glycosyltransferase
LRFRRVQDPERANCFSTRGLFLPARAFVRLGGFHVRLLPHYLSDYEFTIRARRRGFALDSSPEVKLWYNPATTGIRRPSRRTVRDYLAQTITTRSASNPFYWTTFVLLASPRRQLPRNVLIVWLRFVRGLLEAARPGHA